MGDRLLLKSMELPGVLDALREAYPKVLTASDLPGDAKLKLKDLVVGRDLTRTVEIVSLLCAQDEGAKKAVVAAATQLVTTRLDRPRPSFAAPFGDSPTEPASASEAKAFDGWAVDIRNMSRSLHNNKADVVYGLENLAAPRLGADQAETDRAQALARSIRTAVQKVEPSYFDNFTVSNESTYRRGHPGHSL